MNPANHATAMAAQNAKNAKAVATNLADIAKLKGSKNVMNVTETDKFAAPKVKCKHVIYVRGWGKHHAHFAKKSAKSPAAFVKQKVKTNADPAVGKAHNRIS